MEELKIDIPASYEFTGIDDDKQQVVFNKIQSCKESEDEKIRKELIDFITRVYERQALIITDEEKDNWTTWLEKQGEKPQGKSALEAINEKKVDNQNCVKPTDKAGPKFKVGNRVKAKTSRYEYTVMDIRKDCYIMSYATDKVDK